MPRQYPTGFRDEMVRRMLTGEPRLDLIHVTRQDLIYYGDLRQLVIAPSTLAGELTGSRFLCHLE
jgi:hypothetical protein